MLVAINRAVYRCVVPMRTCLNMDAALESRPVTAGL
jgi:hypothetical protein